MQFWGKFRHDPWLLQWLFPQGLYWLVQGMNFTWKVVDWWICSWEPNGTPKCHPHTLSQETRRNFLVEGVSLAADTFRFPWYVPNDGSFCRKVLERHVYTIHIWYITYIYHTKQPNVVKYAIHGWYGYTVKKLIIAFSFPSFKNHKWRRPTIDGHGYVRIAFICIP